jgi:hypothetical protein
MPPVSHEAPLGDRARWAREDAEVVRDSALSIAYRSARLREEAQALRAEAAQIRRRVRAGQRERAERT